jgi:hypothetical protein
MTKSFCFALTVFALTAGLPGAKAQDKPADKAPDKAAAPRTLKVKLSYTGAGTVDEKHKILVFLFDSPDFIQGSVMPFSMKSAQAKDETVTFGDIDKSPVYVATVYDPAGAYDGQSPPPSGSSVGMYGTPPDKPEGVKIDEGKTAEIALHFDDTGKMP